MRWLRWTLGFAVFGLIVGGPLGYAALKDKHLRNFRVVEPGVLYRSGQLSSDGLERVLHDRAIRTVISLRYSEHPDKPPPDAAEEALCRARSIRYVRIRPDSWSPVEDGSIPGDVAVKQFLAVMDDPNNRPALLHCFAGAHRTGIFTAIYRMEYNGWPPDAAIAELRHCGYDNIDVEENVRTYLKHYIPRRK